MKINISIGDVFDKLSILEIKLENIKGVESLSNVVNEYKSIKQDINEVNMTPKLEDLYSKLCDINRMLWDIEDNIRRKEKLKEFDNEFIELARSVYITNDKRCGIKKKINILTNSNIVEEKSYEEY